MKFYSIELGEAADSLMSEIQRVSTDIETLERFLNDLNIPSFESPLPGEGRIYWHPYGKSHRLMYSEAPGKIRPLIETKSDIRIRVSRHLPDVLTSMRNELTKRSYLYE